MKKAKKQVKKQKTKTKNQKVNNGGVSEYSNLLIIFIGVFLIYSLNSSSMGLMGQVMQEVFRGLFGALAMLIPIILIVVGILGFFDNNEYAFRIKHSKISYIALIFVFIFYGLFNSNLAPVDNPLRPEMISSIMKSAVQEGGIGLIPSIIVYYIKTFFGITGGWLLSIFLLLISMLFAFNISIKDVIILIKEKTTKAKNGEINMKDTLEHLKKSALDMVTEEVEEDTINKKPSLLDRLLNRSKDADGDKEDVNEQTQLLDKLDLDEDEEDPNEKTIKIVGFNKAEDDVLEILEGTQSMDLSGNTQELSLNDKVLETTGKFDRKDFYDKDKILNGDLDATRRMGDVDYNGPSIECLKTYPKSGLSKKEDKSQAVKDTLSNFHIEIEDCDITHGPTITRYEVKPKAGTKVSKIVNLSDDLALSLAARSIRIEAPVPGKSVVGIEVPNDNPQVVGLREVLSDKEFIEHPSCLAVGLGHDICGKALVADLAKMPHLLIAGATGSGKSVCINTIITSLIYKSSPKDVKLLLIDPKVVELSNYNGIPHLISPVVTDTKKAANALGWAVAEMNKRYKSFADCGVKDINSYNKKIEEYNKKLEKEPQTEDGIKLSKKEKMYKIVIIIDELADLMMACSNEVEDYICRLAQMARAAGMHLIIATQRPSVDVITGIIKANIPSRIAFAVSSQTDSRTILDMGGAEKLLGKGDMLYYPLGYPKPVRIQGAFISEEESERVIEAVKPKDKKEVKYEPEVIETISTVVKEVKDDEDEFLQDAIDFVVSNGQGSASMLQRKFKIGFNRAARLIDSMEEMGVVGPSEGSRPRKVLISKEELDNMRK